jgi:hypothetical protein
LSFFRNAVRYLFTAADVPSLGTVPREFALFMRAVLI